MLKSKDILGLIGFVLLSLPLFSQKTTSVDSLLQVIKFENNYSKQLELFDVYLKNNYLTKYDETLKLSKFGFEIANKKNDTINKGNFLRFIGGAFVKKGLIDSATTYYFKALKELEYFPKNEKLGLLYDDMARVYRKLNQPKRALEFYDRALNLYKTIGHLEGIARINNESGVVFRENGQYSEANRRFEKSLQIQQQRKDSVGIGYALEFLGYNQLLIKNYKAAETYLQQALEIRKKVGEDFAIMLNYTALGEYYKETKQWEKSNEYFQKSNKIARKIKFLDIQSYNFQQIMENYEVLGNYTLAYQNLKSFNVLKDSLYSVKKLKDVEEITTKYETAEKENLILKQRTEIAENALVLKNRKLWIFGLSSLAIIIGMIGFLLYKQQQLKIIQQQKDNELKLALKEIENQNKLQEQRLTISRDLHDNIGAQLSFIISAIDTIKYYITDGNSQLTNKLNHIGTFAKETIQELRDTIWAMNKSEISIKDLQSRIANFTEKAKHVHNQLTINFIIDKSLPDTLTFTALQGLNIFRIIQEATNNALKYAVANQIEIRIFEQNNSIQFQITDDGKGFIEDEVEKGNGLHNMRKRATELGGVLRVISEPNKGTQLHFSVATT